MELSTDIFKWLEKNKEWFKVSAICKKVGIDKGNFSKYRKEGELPEKFIQPILAIIIPMGFIVKKTELPKNTTQDKEETTQAELPPADTENETPKQI